MNTTTERRKKPTPKKIARVRELITPSLADEDTARLGHGPDAEIEPKMAIVRRCTACGAMGVENVDLMVTTSVTLDGTTHGLATCRNNGACSYEAELLRERLEFRDTDLAPQPPSDNTLHGTDAALDYLRLQFQTDNPGQDITPGECLKLLSDLVLDQEAQGKFMPGWESIEATTDGSETLEFQLTESQVEIVNAAFETIRREHEAAFPGSTLSDAECLNRIVSTYRTIIDKVQREKMEYAVLKVIEETGITRAK